MTITVNLDHAYAGDLVVALVAPDGSSCNLINRLGKAGDCSIADAGSTDDFSAANALNFNSTYTTPIPTGTSRYPAAIMPLPGVAPFPQYVTSPFSWQAKRSTATGLSGPQIT